MKFIEKLMQSKIQKLAGKMTRYEGKSGEMHKQTVANKQVNTNGKANDAANMHKHNQRRQNKL